MKKQLQDHMKLNKSVKEKFSPGYPNFGPQDAYNVHAHRSIEFILLIRKDCFDGRKILNLLLKKEIFSLKNKTTFHLFRAQNYLKLLVQET